MSFLLAYIIIGMLVHVAFMVRYADQFEMAVYALAAEDDIEVTPMMVQFVIALHFLLFWPERLRDIAE